MKLTPDQLRSSAAAMIAFADEKPIQFQFEDKCGDEFPWIDTDNLGRIESVPHRPKPQPKTRPWNSPDDVPVNCWLRESPEDEMPALVIGFLSGATRTRGCIGVITGISTCREILFSNLNGWQYSTTRAKDSWLPCTVEVTE